MLSLFSCVQLFATPRTVVHQAPLFMGFSRQEYWSGLTCPPAGDLPDPGLNPSLLHWQADSSPRVPPTAAILLVHFPYLSLIHNLKNRNNSVYTIYKILT